MILSESEKPGLKNKLVGMLSKPFFLCLLLATVTLAVYWPVTRGDFLNFDDPEYFTSNPHVLNGLTLAGVGWAFTTGHAANWHPLTWLSLMLDSTVFGRGSTGPHLVNLLFHLANTVLLFLLLWRMTSAKWRSAFVSALFALHPLHVESVAWISERKDVLSAFFGLLALLFYVRFAQGKPSGNGKPDANPGNGGFAVTRSGSGDYWLALFFFGLGLMSKPMLVTLPFILLLLDWWPLRRIPDSKQTVSWLPVRLLLEKVPFFLLSVVSCVATLMVQAKGDAVASFAVVSMTGRIENVFVSYARYLGKTFWPMALANPYPHPGHWNLGPVLFAVALFVALFAAAVWLRSRFPFVLFGWFWFVGMLVPTIGLVQVGAQAMADRYTYLPLIGVFVALAWGVGLACADARVPRLLVVFGIAAVLIACAWRTRDQLGYWQNSRTLFHHTLALIENDPVACNNLGTWFANHYLYPEAEDCFRQSLQNNPRNPDTRYNLGNTLARLHQWDEAVGQYRHALQIAPDRADIMNNLGLALAARGQYADAVACFEQALQLKPDYGSAHNNLASIYFMEKRYDEAVRHFRAALRAMPDNSHILGNLGDALIRAGQTNEALQSYQEALRLNPDDAQTKAKLQALGAETSQ